MISGTFSGTQEFVELTPAESIRYPRTVWVNPTAGLVTVQYSVDGGLNWSAVPGMSGLSGNSDATLLVPVTHLKFFGDATAAGTWGIV